ncbi:MAG: hypothetical protein GY715_16575 [Planctomycetes bacterium]|nr:hypothetical protein [Planctomycetota bacterium]
MTIRLHTLEIDRVGPLRGFRLEPTDVTVVEGDNEAGKSSIVVGLHRALRETFARSNAPSFEGTRQRTPGFDGEVSIEITHVDGDGAPLAGPPALLCDVPLLWSLLVIPEGWAGSRTVGSSSDWLQEAIQHLTGFDPEPLERSIRGQAGLTRTGRDAKEWSERGLSIDGQIRAIESFLESLEHLGAQEAELRAARGRLQDLDAAATEERAAAEFDRFERLRKQLDVVDTTERTLPNFARYTRDDLARWRRLDGERREAQAGATEAQSAVETREREVTEARTDVERLREEHRDADDLAARVAGADLLDRARRCRDRGRADEDAERSRWPRWLGWTLVALGSAAVVIGLILRQWAVVGLGALTGAGVALIVTDARRAAPASARARDAARLLTEARTVGVTADDPGSLVTALEQVTEGAATRRAVLDGVRREHARRGEVHEEHAQRLRTLREQVDAIDGELATLRDRTGLATLAELEKNVDERERLEHDKARAEEELRRMLDVGPNRWREMIEGARVRDPGRRPAPGRLRKFERERDDVRHQVQELSAITSRVIERGLATIGFDDQGDARRRLEELRNEQDQRRQRRQSAQLALRAIRGAVDDLEAQLDHALRDPRGGVNAIFSRITNGDWHGVRPTEDGAFEAYGADGIGFPIAALSRGTADQLYFAIRAGLAERVLGAPAFFVWDDTFLTADPSRRRLLVEAAVELVRRGWQIIYLTVDPAFSGLFESVARTGGVRGFSRHRLEGRKQEQGHEAEIGGIR